MIVEDKIKLLKIFCLMFCSFCLSCKSNIKFEKNGWTSNGDILFPPVARGKMLTDLLNHHKLIGLKYSQLEKLIGLPDGKDSGTVYYRIVVEYGRDIDPVYTKDLAFQLSKDSLVTSFKINDWSAK